MRAVVSRMLLAAGMMFPGLASAQDSGLDTDVVLEATYRGAHGDGGESDNRWGLGISVGLPVHRGLDVGVAWGEMFRDNGTLHVDYRARLYLSDVRSGLYAGAGYVSNGDSFGYGTLGYQISFMYGEVDFKSGEDRPVDMVPEFGLRLRF